MSGTAEVYIQEAGVYLYIHGTEGDNQVIQVVQKALRKRVNWRDPAYLARTIFCALVEGTEDGDIGLVLVQKVVSQHF